MEHNGTKRAAELEREVEAQRNRVESTIGEIRDRLSPGQLVDELLSYTKHGGAHFASNLGHTMTANPLPVALIGVGIAWLMSGQKPLAFGADSGAGYAPSRPADPVYGSIKGSGLRRVSHAADEAGDWYSSFADDAGTTYRARSNEAGHRTGHFVDSAGKQVTGFIDDTGRHVSNFRDEAGNMLDQAAGWANHAWHEVREAVGQQASAVMDQAGNALGQVQRTAADAQRNATRMGQDALRVLEDQPLVLGALAFAAGAALGATLPHTEQEDELMGDAADKVKRGIGETAGDLYAQGKDVAAEAYDELSQAAGDIYDETKGKLSSTAAPQNGQPALRH